MQSWHLWTITGLLLLILEMLLPAFFFASFGVAALATAAAAWAGLGLSPQLATFALTSIVCIAAVRPLFLRFVYHRKDPTPANHHALIGQSATVVDAIGPGDDPGRVKLGSEEWRAINQSGSPLPPGTRVQITAVNSATLTVSPRLES